MATAADLKTKLDSLGLGFLFAVLEPKLSDTTIDVTDVDIIGQIIETDPTVADQYKQRFAGNELRAKAGLRPLKPSEYIQAEKEYTATLRNSGMPIGFYDQPSDLARFIGADVSNTELEGRISSGYKAASISDAATKAQLKNLYGIDDADLAAYYLDPTKATDVIGRKKNALLFSQQLQAAQTSAQAATQANMALTSAQAEELAAQGITGTTAKNVFSTIGKEQELYNPLQGEQAITQEEQIAGTAGTSAAAAQRIAQRRRQRTAAFETGGGFAATQQGATGLKTVGE